MTPTGRIIFRPDGKHEYFVDGKPVTRRVYEKRFPSKLKELRGQTAMTQRPSCWPQENWALGVGAHPHRQAELHAKYKAAGINVEINKWGNPIIRSRGQLREICKVEKCVNYDAGYSDHQGG